jgi:PKD repeat protein
LKITASPDVLTADGFSTSIIQVVVRDQNGRLASGRSLLFNIRNSLGETVEIGTLHNPAGDRLFGGDATATTDGNGIATVVYTSPFRTDFTADSTILIAVRPVGTDANAATYRSVRIELRSAEPHPFPNNPNADLSLLICNFVVEPAVGPFRIGQVISLQDSSTDANVGGVIIKYEWDFGDGVKEDKPETAHVFFTAGTFTITHVVTDNFGLAKACSVDVPVI